MGGGGWVKANFFKGGIKTNLNKKVGVPRLFFFCLRPSFGIHFFSNGRVRQEGG